jgi:hypothetical protein
MSLYGSRYNGAQTFPGQNQLYQRQIVAPFTESEYIQNVYTKKLPEVPKDSGDAC